MKIEIESKITEMLDIPNTSSIAFILKSVIEDYESNKISKFEFISKLEKYAARHYKAGQDKKRKILELADLIKKEYI